MKKSIALVLALVMVFALCACGAKEDLTGKWTTTINFAEPFNQEMAAADPTMAEYMKLESFNIPMILELKEDGTCAMSVNAEAMDATLEKLVDDMTAGLEAYFIAIFAEQGLEVESVDEVLQASMGMTLDQFGALMLEQFDTESLYAEMLSEGKYKAENGKLYISDSLDTEINPAVYNTYTLEGDTLTLDVGTEELEEGMEIMFPMVLTRVVEAE